MIMEAKKIRQVILNTVEDLCSGFLYYDRKEDEELSSIQLNEAIASGQITVDEIITKFRNHLEDTFGKQSQPDQHKGGNDYKVPYIGHEHANPDDVRNDIIQSSETLSPNNQEEPEGEKTQEWNEMSPKSFLPGFKVPNLQEESEETQGKKGDEELMKCNECGEMFNPANLAEVFLHEHDDINPSKAIGIKGQPKLPTKQDKPDQKEGEEGIADFINDADSGKLI